MPGGAPQVLGGPLWWSVVGLYLFVMVLAAFVLVDSLRPLRRDRLAELPEPAWVYPALTGLHLVCFFGVWIPGMPRALSVIPVILTLVMLPTGVAYLLRVVYPKPVADHAAEGQTPERAT